MKKLKGIWILPALLLVWYGIALGLRAGLPETLSAEENAFLLQQLETWCMDTENARTDVLRDAQGTPRYMYVTSPGGYQDPELGTDSRDGYLIYDRFGRSFCSGGDHDRFAPYPEAQKFYEPPLSLVMQAKDLPEDVDPADEGYYLFGPGEHLDRFSPGVVGWLWSNLKLPAQALRGLITTG